MSTILKVRNVNDYGNYLGCVTKHPFVCVVDYAEVSPIRHSLNNYSVYGLFLRDDADVALDYGRGKYDYHKGTLLCVAPGQVGGKEDNGEQVSITGWALLFHPDLLHGFPLEKHIKEYSFFDYRVNEALHMTDEEHDILVSLMRQIQDELFKKPDELQNTILVGYIELMLNFCQRFYNRQFLTRKIENSDILVRFDRLLRDYFEDKLQLTLGLPSVQYCADKLCLSPNYFGDVIKKPLAIRQAITSVDSSSGWPRTDWQRAKPCLRYPTDSALNIPSISVACSRSKKASLLPNTASSCTPNKQVFRNYLYNGKIIYLSGSP